MCASPALVDAGKLWGGTAHGGRSAVSNAHATMPPSYERLLPLAADIALCHSGNELPMQRYLGVPAGTEARSAAFLIDLEAPLEVAS